MQPIDKQFDQAIQAFYQSRYQMDIIDHLNLQPTKQDYIDSLSTLYTPDQIQTLCAFGTIINTGGTITLNIQ